MKITWSIKKVKVNENKFSILNLLKLNEVNFPKKNISIIDNL